MRDIDLEEELAQSKLNRDIFKRIMSYLKPFRWQIAVSVVVEILWVLSTIFDKILIKHTVDSILPQNALLMLILFSIIFLCNIIFRYFSGLFQSKIIIKAGQQILNNIRKDVFKKIESLHIGYFDKTKEGRIIARADRDIETLEIPLVWGPTWFINCVTNIIFTFITMALLNWRLCLILTVILLPLIVATNIFRIKGMEAYRKIRESLAVITSFISESISGIKVLKSFVKEKNFYNKFLRINRNYKNVVISQARIWNAFFPIINILFNISIVLIIFFGSLFSIQGIITQGTFIAFLLLLENFFWPIEGLSVLYNLLLSATSAAERIFLLLDTEPAIVDSTYSRDIKDLKGKVEFKNVYFKYDHKTAWILNNLNFIVKKNKIAALVGPTGSGKSSILNLLVRFYEPQKGKILFDDKDIKEITIKSLRNKIGIVLQDNFLFSGTVMYNLKYGNPSIPDQEVIKLAKEIGSHKIISNLERGYYTEVKERGEGLSQGERQLICLTRIFVANPQIVILDEATSSIDTNTELLIQKALKKLLINRTTFIAAHRLSTIRNADLILMVYNGKITESGSFSELLKKNKQFKKLYSYYTQ